MHPDTLCKDKLKVLLKQAAAGDFAPGLPDPMRFGDVKDIPKDRLLPYVVQLHKARRAGTHYDVRFGPDQLYSWATKKELPGPGKKTLLFQQPLHCFPPNMRVETEQGAIEIGKIVEEKMAIRVLSTDDDGKTTYERVTNYWKRDNRDDLLHFMVAVPFTRTAHIVCTKEHRLFSHGEKIEAGNLVKGDMLDRILPCPNPDQEQILLGSFLGDSHVGPHCVFRFFHSLSNEEYFWWKAEMLKTFFRTNIESKSKGSYSKTPMLVASGPSNHPWFSYFDKYRGEGLIDREYLERLGPLALAIWYQDDGSISKSGSTFSGCSIATHSYPIATISAMRDWFRDRFGLKSFAVARGNKDCWELRFNSSESMKFFEIISPYIHPSMSYKIELPDSWHRRKCKVCGCDVSCNVQLCDTCFIDSLSPYSNSGDFRKAYYRKETLISPKTINNRCGTWEKAKSGEFVVSSEPITIPSFVCGSRLPDLSSKEEFKVCPVRIVYVRKVGSADRKYPVVYDLEVENTHRYVIQGGFVVSNSGSYADFEGELTSGYGAGTVKTYDKGKVIVTKAEPDHINFTVTHKKFPENYSLVRVGGAPESSFKTARGRASQGGTWLLVNTTPRDAAKMLGGKPEEVGLSKLRYVRIPAEEVEKVFDPAYLVQEKIDGASTLFHLLSDRIEALSYRTGKSGHPIVHTYRIFGPGGGKVYTKPIPPELVGTILKGETYGERIGGGVIPVQELGGILNASVLRSLEKQKEGRVRLKNMLFDVVRMGKEPVEPLSLTPEERLAKLREVSKVLPKRIFHLPETAKTPEEARSLFERISSGKHPRTAEGIVAWPREPGKVPRKVKLSPEADVWIKSIFPGMGKLEGAGAGGFEYSRSPEGPVVGRVGTGFTEQTRKEMLEDPESWIGRIARIHSQGDFPRTGAFRAPSFVGLHEDYPMKTAALKPDVVLQPHQERVIEKIKQEPAVLVFHGLGSGKTLASIAAGEQFPGKKEIIVPASLRENYAKELKKFVRGTPQGYNIKSYQKAVEEPPDPEAALTVFDEAHRMGRAGTQVSVLPSKAQGKTLLLSGTPLRNDPGEIAPLLRVLARDRDAPESGKMFNALFIGERELPQGFWEKVFNVPPGTEQFLRNKQRLRDLLAGRVDYHPAAGEYPERINERVEVDMDPVQSKLYRGFLNSNPKIAYKIIRNLPPNKNESVVLNSFLNAVRQISNNPKPFDKTLTGHPFEYSAKMRRMFSELQKGITADPNFKGLVYSNYLESGIVPLAEKLGEAGIPHGVYTGELDDKRKRALVDAYNAGTIKVLLVSGAGSEGLDLKGTKLIQVMEPHWNDARVEQVIGRGIRHRSHVHLPPEERKVRFSGEEAEDG